MLARQAREMKLGPEQLARFAVKLGEWERRAIAVWNAIGGEVRMTEVTAAADYYEFDDFDALMELLSVIRAEINRRD